MGLACNLHYLNLGPAVSRAVGDALGHATGQAVLLWVAGYNHELHDFVLLLSKGVKPLLPFFERLQAHIVVALYEMLGPHLDAATDAMRRELSAVTLADLVADLYAKLGIAPAQRAQS